MKIAQWSRKNLKEGLGGVETWARSVHRELLKKSINAIITDNLNALESENCDFIITHGSCPLPIFYSIRNRKRKKIIHVLHGSSLGRLICCKEFLSRSAWKGTLNEIIGILTANIVIQIRPIRSYQWIIKLAQKKTILIGNGFDSYKNENQQLPSHVQDRIKKHENRFIWAFIGRDSDPVKRFNLFIEIASSLPNFLFLCAPGSITRNNIYPTHELSHGQISSLLDSVQGIVLTSCYEGMPLVILEALSKNKFVITSNNPGSRWIHSLFSSDLIKICSSKEDFRNALLECSKKETIQNYTETFPLNSWETVAEQICKEILYDK